MARVDDGGGEIPVSWYRLSLVGDVDKNNQAAWQLAWDVSQAKARIDYSSAIFKKVDGGNGQTIYFTPSAQLLAQTFGAMPCGKPSPLGVRLFVGDDRAWRIHFVLLFWRRSIQRTYRHSSAQAF